MPEETAVITPAAAPDGNAAQPSSTHLARRAAQGAAALMVRQGLVYGSNIAGGIILARLLTPAEFGFYGVVLFFVVFLNIFGGTGLAANLIRIERHPSLREFRAVFSAQQAVVGSIFVAIWLVSPWLALRYHMQQHGAVFFRLIGLALVLTSLMVISQVLMERELAFGKLAIVEVAQSISFNLVAIVLAWRGAGALSFAIALAVRAACGAVLSNILEPWSLGWLWDADAMRKHLRFGLALQGGQLVSLAKDSITPIFVGLYLGAGAMGYVTWASTLAGYPIMVLMPLQRLYLPFFARLQSDRVELRRFVSHALWMANAVAAPLIVVTIALAHPITLLVFGSKWLVALPLFYCIALGSFFSPSSTPLLGVLNAVGKSHLTLMVSTLWMAITWVIGVPLMMRFGITGFAGAIVIVHCSNLVLYWLAWDKLSISPWPAYWPSWPLAAILGLALKAMQHFCPIHSLKMLVAFGVTAGMVYGLILWFGFPLHTRSWLRVLKKTA